MLGEWGTGRNRSERFEGFLRVWFIVDISLLFRCSVVQSNIISCAELWIELLIDQRIRVCLTFEFERKVLAITPITRASVCLHHRHSSKLCTQTIPHKKGCNKIFIFPLINLFIENALRVTIHILMYEHLQRATEWELRVVWAINESIYLSVVKGNLKHMWRSVGGKTNKQKVEANHRGPHFVCIYPNFPCFSFFHFPCLPLVIAFINSNFSPREKISGAN